MSALQDQIWITGKSRMQSEKRYRAYDLASHLSLAYMSVLMVIATVFSNTLKAEVAHFETIRIVLAIFLFALSLVIHGFRFAETANKHRECYLKLQSLGRTPADEAGIGKAYDDILSRYPNHAPRDYDDLVLNRTFFKSEKLTSGGKDVSWDKWMLTRKIARIFSFWSLVLALPCGVTFLLLSPFLSTFFSSSCISG